MDTRPWHRFYDGGVPTSPEFEDVAVPEFLVRSVAQFPDATALIFMNRRMSYRELKEDVDRFATALAGLGVGKGTKVGIQLANIPQTVIAYYACLSLGGQVVMTNPLYVEREIEHQWNDAGCSVAVVSDYLFEGRIRAIRDKLPVEHYVVTSIPEYLRFPLNFLVAQKLKRAKTPMVAKVAPGEGIHFMMDLIRANPPNPPKVEIDMDDIAVLQYTGGTTGVSKGAMLTHRNLSCNVQQIRAWFTGIEPGRDVFLACLPYFHVYGMTVCMNFPVSVAAAIVLMPDPRDISRLISNIAKHRVTMFPGVPAQFNSINNFPGVEKLDLTSVKSCFSASAALPSAVRDRFEEVTQGTIVEGFGMTETSPVTHCNPLGGTRKTGSIGVPVPGTDAKIVSLEDGTTELPVGAEGELLLKGPQVMKGYWKQPGETAETIKDGWLYTGDIATIDEDGYFFIVGRKKEVIIAGGFNIYPDEVDDVLTSHPAVLESGTIGVPDEKRGETVKSFVVLAAGRSATAEELVAYCRQELAAYKIPRQIEFRDSLPKSAALKILRRELRDEELKAGSNQNESKPSAI
ncbi:MAG: long-chain fatty acid--CoA ligase [Armatimonadetes bacterium]|nr:long-chain fatty acid--CoA ligase [Armatimonadota bacterium]